MGDRVAVLHDGVLQQCAAPRELYRAPANVFVAGFMGSPAMNLFTLPVAHGSVSLGGWSIPLPRAVADVGDQVVLGIRPEDFELHDTGIEFVSDVVEELGADAYLYGRSNAHAIVVRVDGRRPVRRGELLHLRPIPAQLHYFGADGQRIG